MQRLTYWKEALVVATAILAIATLGSWGAVASFGVAVGLWCVGSWLSVRTASERSTAVTEERLASLERSVTALEGLPQRVTQIDNRTRHLAERHR